MNSRRTAIAVIGVALGIYLLKQYMAGCVCTSTERLDGKIVIVTGANSGIGKETVKNLVQRGAKIYLACRSLERARAAVDDIVNGTGVEASQLQIMRLDLGSLQSIRDFADAFKKREKKLDILINNAGLIMIPRGTTADGFEATFGINHLGHFLLTHLLLDIIVSSSSPSRIINVSALAHVIGTINFDDLMMEKNFDGAAAYTQSKLANILFTRELSRRLKGTLVTTYSLHPGIIDTELKRNINILNSSNVFIRTFLRIVSWPFVKDAWNGAQTTVCCAVDKSLETQSGKYYSDCVETEPIAEALDDDIAKRLWEVSVQLVKLAPSEIHPLLR